MSASGVSSAGAFTPPASGYSFELSAKYVCVSFDSIWRTKPSARSLSSPADASTPTPATLMSEPRSSGGKCTLTG